ncbi:hypothetical protein H0Z60_15725 [Ectothiorhodospiraceae bacterium WFHF3C12]|nr:hypothetical protein [Ectothiorhodospiraceae bacterium WFHF3C12]
MRTLTDDNGTTWTATVGRESYGMQVILFFPDDGKGVRKALMASDTRLDAQRELADMDAETLRERLDVSQPWEAESPFGGG